VRRDAYFPDVVKLRANANVSITQPEDHVAALAAA